MGVRHLEVRPGNDADTRFAAGHAERRRCWRIVHSEHSMGWGGQEHRVLSELVGFRGRGHGVMLLAPPGARLLERAKAAEVTAARYRPGKWAFGWECLRLARRLREWKVDVLNTHSSRDGWLLGLAGRLAGTPLIIRTRHIEVDYPNRWFSRHAFATLADHVLTTSERIRVQFVEELGLAADRVSVVPTGIDLRKFSAAGAKADLFGRTEARRVTEDGAQEGPQSGIVSGGSDERPVVGMVSVLRSWKGHETFMEAAALLARECFEADWVIVGDGPIRGTLATQIEERGLGAIMRMVGHREDVPEVLRALDLLVIASVRHEGVPQIGLQALACRVPVVGSDVGGIPEIIRPGETGRLFRAGDAKGLARMIRETLEERQETERLVDTGLRWVTARYSLERMLDLLEDLYLRRLGA